MDTLVVVKVEVVKGGGRCIVWVQECVTRFILERAEKALCNTVIPTIGFATHAERDAGFGQLLSVLAAGVLTATIGVH